MGTSNTSIFIIIGFSDLPDLEMSIFLFFLLSYIISLFANLFLIALIYLSPMMKSPMYFFLCNLSGVDILCESTISPKLMYIFLAASGTISFSECITQFSFSTVSSVSEYLILTVMSYDRYVAVCKPLHYTQILSNKLCVTSSHGVWMLAFLISLVLSVFFILNDFCFSNVVDHYFCDFSSLLELSCRYTSVIQALAFAIGVLFVTCFLLTVTSYTFIISSILKIQSLQGIYKAFSTCASHLAAVTLFYLVLFILYLLPNEVITQKQRKVMSILCTNVIPMLNPFIYSLRNTDVNRALQLLIRLVQLRWL